MGAGLLALALGGIHGQAAAQGNGAGAAGAQGFPPIVAVRTRTTPSSVPVGGTVVSRHDLRLTAQTPGRVVYLVGPEGTKVGPRQLLVGLDDDDVLARRRSAWGSLAKSVSALQDAHVQLQRELYAGGYSAQGGMGLPQMMDFFFTKPVSNYLGVGNTALERSAGVNRARVAVEQAQASVIQAQSAVDEIDARLRDKKVVSPGYAVVLEKYVEVGDIVQPGQPLLRIADTEDLQVEVDLPTRLLFGLEEGVIVPVKVDATGATLRAKLERIYPSANPASHTVKLKLALPLGAPAAPGMYVKVNMPERKGGVKALPVVPVSAILWRGSQPTVFVVNGSDVEMRLVRLGEREGNEQVVLSGLREGESILASPPANMVSGQPVPAAERR